MAPTPVSYVRPLLATKRFGVTVGDAVMQDGRVLRFRVQSRDPLTVQLYGTVLPGDQATVESWLIAHREVVSV